MGIYEVSVCFHGAWIVNHYITVCYLTFGYFASIFSAHTNNCTPSGGINTDGCFLLRRYSNLIKSWHIFLQIVKNDELNKQGYACMESGCTYSV